VCINNDINDIINDNDNDNMANEENNDNVLIIIIMK